MRTLIVAPHMDDETISCGGLIQRRLAAGADVGVLCVYGRVYDYGRHDGTDEEMGDFLAAKDILGYQHHWLTGLREGEPAMVGYYKVLEVVEGIASAFRPDEIVIPAGDDLNQDHRFLHHVLGIVLRPINLGSVVRVLEFLALDGSLRSPMYFVPLTDAQVETKLAAIAAYRREARAGTSPRAPDNVVAQLKVWGAACGAPFAEAYRLRFAKEGSHEGGCDRFERLHRDEPDAVPVAHGT